MTDETVMTETSDVSTKGLDTAVINDTEEHSEQIPEVPSEAVDNTDVPSTEPELLDETEDQSGIKDEAESLRDEIHSLRQRITELEAERDTQARLIQEVADFAALFPDVDLELIPESVWDSVRKGTPLMASYALYEKRMKAEEARIAKINASNASRSAGVAGKDAAGEYFSPDEVRRMSPSEVHANYSKIKESMKKWI